MFTYDDVVLLPIEAPVTELVFVEDTSLEFVGGGTITNNL
jgi:hypothetical protein